MLGSPAGRTAYWRSWLFAPPVEGVWAVVLSIAAVVTPTAIRLTIAGGTDRFECVTFCPFVLAAAVLVGWRYAMAVVIASAVVIDLMPAPYNLNADKSELIGLAGYLLYSLVVIGLVLLARKMARRSLKDAGADERTGGIVFSSEGGDAWASWYGTDPPIRLGPEEEVARMMEDFLAQLELGKRLLNRRRS